MAQPCGRGPWPGWLAALAAGCALGALSSLSSALGSPYTSYSLVPGRGVRGLEYLAAWLGAGWAWALLAFVTGWCSTRLPVAAARGVAGLWAAVVVYYLSDAALGADVAVSVGEIGIWSAISVVVGPVMAALGWAAHRRRWWSLLAGLAAPTIMVLDTAQRPTGPDSIRPAAQWWVYLLAAALSIALVVRSVVVRRAVGVQVRDRAAGEGG